MREAVLRGPARWAHVLGTLVLITVAGVGALLVDATPPDPVPASAQDTRFSADRAAEKVRTYASVPHPNGSARNAANRHALEAELRANGLRVRTQRGVGMQASPEGDSLARVENIVATLPGRDPTGSVLLVTHYDSVPGAPGAADAGASVAALLETVRALRASTPPRNDVVLLITDGEEQGLLGAASFVRDDPLADRPGVVLNWEARGTSGVSLMFETSTGNAPLIQAFARGAPHPNGDSSLVELYRLLPNDTDFTELKTTLPGLNSAFIGNPAFYHTPQDSPANLDRGSLQQHGANMLGLAREFGGLDLSTLDSDRDETYFRFLGLLVHYPDTVSTVLVGLAVAALLIFAWLVRRRRLASVPGMLGAALSAPIPLAVAAALAEGVGLAVVTLRPELDDAVYADTMFGVAAALTALFALLLWYVPLRRTLGPAALAVGGLTLPVVLGAGCAVAVPGMSFLFTVPALGALLGGIVALRTGATVGTVAYALGTAPLVVLYVPFAVLNYVGLGLAGGGGAGTAVAVFLAGLMLLPLLEQGLPVAPKPAMPVTAVAFVAAVTVASSGLLVGQYDTRHPERSMLAYVLRTDTRTASWVSADAASDSWGRGFADGSAPVPDVLDSVGVSAGRARPITAPAPLVRRDGERVRVASRRGASTITVSFQETPRSLTVRVPGFPAVPVRPQSETADGAYRLVFHDLPADGIELDLADRTRTRLAVYDRSNGLSDLPGFRPRPFTVDTTAHPDDNAVFVGGTFTV